MAELNIVDKGAVLFFESETETIDAATLTGAYCAGSVPNYDDKISPIHSLAPTHL